MPALLNRLLSLGDGKLVRKLGTVVDQVNALEADFVAMSDTELQAMTEEFRSRLTAGETEDDLLPEAFATVREAARRVLGKRHYDVQVMGGAALHLGYIAEMKTGEGKTLVSTLPAYLNALSGRGVHVVTVNDYLAGRDAEQMGRVHGFLGLSVAAIDPDMEHQDRKAAYGCDITYGTNNEFGFDYLRDNMAATAGGCVQRGHHFAIVDEVDSILVDEARTPLIISGEVDQDNHWYGVFADLVASMVRDEHYTVDEKQRQTTVTAAGVGFVESRLGLENLYAEQHAHLLLFLESAVKAKELFARDQDYIVTGEGEVMIVDEHTGRVLAGRRYAEGIHQAIEAKEGVELQAEYQTLASVTFQNYFREYDKLSGMTGTAMTEVAEFFATYDLPAVEIPTNVPISRIDQPDIMFRDEDDKFAAVVADVQVRHQAGQPVLIGTASVAKSELVSAALTAAGIEHRVLNAKQNEAEAAVVAMAGRVGAVTVATNMAGRGTDIMLGGNAETLTELELHAAGLHAAQDPGAYQDAWARTLATHQAETATQRAQVVALGGLYVVGTERHESRRIDNQLRGRSGRQGDPGESRFYVSLGDDLMQRFKADWVAWMVEKMNLPQGAPIENPRMVKSAAAAQTAVENQNYESRKSVLKYDDVLNTQRKVIYAERRQVLTGDDLGPKIAELMRAAASDVVDANSPWEKGTWDIEGLAQGLRGLGVSEADAADIGATVTPDHGVRAMRDLVWSFTSRVYAAFTAEMGEDVTAQVEANAALAAFDHGWRHHLYAMDYLRAGIQLRSYAQKDPLVEYRSEAFDAFEVMLAETRVRIVQAVFAYARSATSQILKARTDAATAAGETYESTNLTLTLTPSGPGAAGVPDESDTEEPAGALEQQVEPEHDTLVEVEDADVVGGGNELLPQTAPAG